MQHSDHKKSPHHFAVCDITVASHTALPCQLLVNSVPDDRYYHVLYGEGVAFSMGDIASVSLLRDPLLANFERATLRARFKSAKQARNGASR